VQIILATNNNGKLKEFKEILAPFGLEVKGLKDIGYYEDIIEDGNSFFENALIKAKTIYEYTNLPVISDDSGICVDALNGEPGIYTARYGNLNSDAERRLYLLKKLEGVDNRKAHFHCAIVFYMNKDKYEAFEGKAYGDIALCEKGVNGFGYDSIFIPEGYKETFAELDSYQKYLISHRGKATKAFVEYIKNDFINK